MLTPYFSAAWWQALDTMLESCRRLGLEFFIWDDDYFPSGLCGGRVLWTDPGLAARELRFKTVEVSGAGPFEIDFERGLLVGAYAIPRAAAAPEGVRATLLDLAPYCGTRRQEWGPRYVLHRGLLAGHQPARTPPLAPPTCTRTASAVVWTPEQPGDYLIVGATVETSSTTHPDLLRPDGIRLFLELTTRSTRGATARS